MRTAVRNALLLTGCLTALGVAGGLATVALRTASVSPTQLANATVVVDTNDEGGTAKLTVLASVRVSTGGGDRTVTAGTQFATTNALLTDALPAPGKAVVGSTLSCDLRVGSSQGQPVIDLVRCVPTKTSARG
jgi:hypothetical protein